MASNIFFILTVVLISNGLFVDAVIGDDFDPNVGKDTIKQTIDLENEPPTIPPPGAINAPKKIIFDDSKDIEFIDSGIPDGGIDIEVGSKEDEEASQWLVVTSSGYEYEGSPDVVNEIFFKANISVEGSIADLISEYGDPVSEDDLSPGTKSKRTVFGADSRVRVNNPNLRFPWRAMGQVGRHCTGTFIGPRHVLTAGHCVYNSRTRQWRSDINFRRGKDCSDSSGSYYIWTRALSTRGWTVFGYKSYDYAVIVVNRVSPVYMSYGWNSLLYRLTVNIAGYPGDIPGNCMWRTSCTTQYHYTEQLGYYCDTAGGMSGSAVYAYFSNTNRRIIYCIDAYSGSIYNVCTRITRTRFQILQRWIRDY